MEPAALSHQPTVESIDEFLSVALEENADTSSSKDNSHIFRCRRPTLNDFDAIHEFAVMHAANEPNVEQKDCNSIGYLEVLRKVLDAKVWKKINLAKNESKIQMRLRRATGSDAESILKLVQGLALYEKASHEVSVTAAIYRRDGDGDDDDDDDRSPLFHCILVEAVTTTKSTEHGLKDKYSIKVVGMGFWYLGYSLDSGKYLYLEDLFIEPEYRGCGCGKALMYSLADIALNLSCNRFLWQALKWNTPALGFYNSIGAKVYEGLMTLRLDQDKIDAFSL
eukprot:826612_1